MSLIEETIKTLDERQSVTTISANARIDYILRFSKHAVLVIDNEPDVYSNVGNEFLASLSPEHNAAFVPISSKLNDIQIRCRIIEQLFGNSLFDPEQPLSVNVVKLSEAKNVAISIVIGNAEFLSVQITHELCQLTEVAKKLNKTINVLLLGKVQAAINLSENKHLFDNKVSILLAESGQLLGLNSALLQKKSSIVFNKTSLIVSLLLLIIVLAIYTFSQEFFFKDNTESLKDTTVTDSLVVDAYKKDFVKVKISNDETFFSDATTPEELIATPNEVFQSLTADIGEPITRERTHSIANMPSTHPINKNVDKLIPDISAITELNDERVLKEVHQDVSKESQNTSTDVYSNEAYYQNIAQGYVIQLASFDKLTGFNSFLSTYKKNRLYGYTRGLNNKVSYIVTTQVYNTNSQAKSAINELSQELRQRGPWVKSIQAVNNEINLYQQSK